MFGCRSPSNKQSRVEQIQKTVATHNPIIHKAKTFSPSKKNNIACTLVRNGSNQSNRLDDSLIDLFESHTQNRYYQSGRRPDTQSLTDNTKQKSRQRLPKKQQENKPISALNNEESKRLQKRVEQLVSLRQRIVSKLYDENLLTDRNTQSTQPIQMIASTTSVESDIDKQVNFVYAPESQDFIKLSSGELGRHHLNDPPNTLKKRYGNNCIRAIPQEIINVQPDLSAISILVSYLSRKPDLLKDLFSGPNSQNSYEVNVSINGRKKTILLGNEHLADSYVQPVISKKEVFMYPILIEKVAQKVLKCNGDIDICKLFELFVPVNTHSCVISEELAELACEPSNNVYILNTDGSYHQLRANNRHTFEIDNGLSRKSVSLDYLSFLYGKAYVLQGVNSLLTRHQVKVSHHINHFNIVTLSLFADSEIYIRSYDQQSSHTHLVLFDTKTKSIQSFKPYHRLYLKVKLNQGEYELYVSTTATAVNVEVLSTSKARLHIRHKQEYRQFSSQLVHSYLKDKLKEICSCKQATLVRCELFIGFCADIVCNPTNQPKQITLCYQQQVMCDLNYTKKRITFTIQPMSCYIIPLKSLAQVNCSVSLSTTTVRI